MAIDSKRLDGENVGLLLSAPSLVVDVLTLNMTTGAVTSGTGASGDFFTSKDVGFLEDAAQEIFSIVPFGDRAAAASVILSKLCQVSAADASSVTLSAVFDGVTSYTLRATVVAAPAALVAHISHSLVGALTWSGSAAGGGGGGTPGGPAGGVLGYADSDGTNTSTYPDPNGLAGIATPSFDNEIPIRNQEHPIFLRVQPGLPGFVDVPFNIHGSYGVTGDNTDPGVSAGGVEIFGGHGAEAWVDPGGTQAATAGGNVSLRAGDGGHGYVGTPPNPNGAAGNAGSISILAGSGGFGDGVVDATTGGNVIITAGTGGQCDLAPGAGGKSGDGGDISLVAGGGEVSGESIGANAGRGGNAYLLSGGGGAATEGGGQANNGGFVQVKAGDGGDGANTLGMVSNFGADGGEVRIWAGDGGSSSPSGAGVGGGRGGDVSIRAGASGQPAGFGPPQLDQNDGRVYVQGVPAFVPDPGGVASTGGNFDLTGGGVNYTLGPAQFGTIYLTASAGNVQVQNTNPAAVGFQGFLSVGKYDGEVVRLVNTDHANSIELFSDDGAGGAQTIYTGLALGASSRTLERKGGNITLMWCIVSSQPALPGFPVYYAWLEVAFVQGPCYGGPP